MQVARRVYIYLVTFISLVMLLLGAANLLRLALESILGVTQSVISGNYLREQLSIWGAVAVVGALVWGVHWMLAQRSVAPSNPDADQERRSVLRKLLIYAALFTTLLQVYFALAHLIQNVLFALPDLGSDSLRANVSGDLSFLLVNGLAWAYYWRVRNADNAATQEEEGAATVRRWYFYLVNFWMLSTGLYSIANLARFVWERALAVEQISADTNWVPFAVANSVGWIIMGMGLWLLHWLPMQRLVAVSEEEQRSSLRKVYLYGIILETVSVTLTGAAVCVYNVLRYFIGTNPLAPSEDTLLTPAGSALLTAVVYGLFWAYHWQVVKWDAMLVLHERPLQASVRRLYYYLVALIGLVVLAVGITSMVRLLLDFWLGGSATTNLSAQVWGDQISFFATLVLAGGPVWFISWLRLQRQALALTADGAEERQSLVRRIYLYVTLFFSVIALLAAGSWLIREILLRLGETIPPSVISNISWALGASLTAGVFLAYHARTLIVDQQVRAGLLAHVPAAIAPTPQEQVTPAVSIAPVVGRTAILLVQGKEAGDVSSAVAALQNSLTEGTEVEVLAAPELTPAELTMWLAGRSAVVEANPSPTPPPPTPPPPQASELAPTPDPQPQTHVRV